MIWTVLSRHESDNAIDVTCIILLSSMLFYSHSLEIRTSNMMWAGINQPLYKYLLQFVKYNILILQFGSSSFLTKSGACTVCAWVECLRTFARSQLKVSLPVPT